MNQVYQKAHQFKNISAKPALLGFGCMRLPLVQVGKAQIDEETAQQMVDRAYQNGVNYFDTAYPYHEGLSELFIGKALKKYPRQSFYLADKMPTWLIETVDDVKRIFNEQLKKCQVEYFDFYLCHALNRDTYKVYEDEAIKTFLLQMKAEGKIKHLGFSFHDTPEILREIMQIYPWDFVQLQINYLDWRYQRSQEQYQIVAEYNIPVIVMEPVRGGMLANLSKDAVTILKEAEPQHSIASWAIRYAASLDNVLVVLSGMSNELQVTDNLQTMIDFQPLTAHEQNILDKALKVFLNSKMIPCTGCRYCMDCPFGVDIPLMFEIYNRYAIDHSKSQLLREYKAVVASKRADHCVACQRCVKHCPQMIDIPSKLQEMMKNIKETEKVA